MDDLAIPANSINGSHKSPVIAIVNDQVLPRSCIVNILKRELCEFEIAEMSTTGDLNGLSGRIRRLIAFNIGGRGDRRSLGGGSPLADRGALPERARGAVVKIATTEATATAAMQRGVRGFCSRAQFRLRSRWLACALFSPEASIGRCPSSNRIVQRYRNAPQLQS